MGALLGLLVALAAFVAPPTVPLAAAASAPAADCILPDAGSMGRLDWDSFRRPIGTVRAVMLFVDFADAPATRPVDAAVEQLGVARASDWLSQSSYGKVSLAIEPVRQWLRMPRPLSAYERVNGALIDDVARGYTAEAIAAADRLVDFSGAALVYIVPNQEASAYSRSSQHDFPPETGPLADGRVIRASVTFGTAVYERGYRTIAHETAHAFGLYDYYNAFGRPTDRYAGRWSLMADSIVGGDHFAWDKWRMGWLTDAQVRCVTSVAREEFVVSPVETRGGVKAVMLRTGLQTAVVAEYRTRAGLDRGLCSAGVLIYKVNGALEGGAGPVRVSDARPRSASGRSCGGELDDAAYSRGGRWTDSASGIAIEVTYLGKAARIRVTRSKPYAPPALVERSVNAALVANADGSVTLSAALATTSPNVGASCTAGRLLSLQELRLGEWWTVHTAPTDAAGNWIHTWTPTPGAAQRLRAPQHITSARDCALVVSGSLGLG